MNYYQNILEAVGQTPLVKINKLNPTKHLILAKLESFNPGGSVKDRMALHIINEAEKTGLLKPGGTIIEATSGNTGVGLALIAAVKGYQCIFTIPDKMSQEKIDLLKAFGARVIVTPTNISPDSPKSYYQVAKKLARQIPNSFYVNQYHNLKNPEAHYLTTGPEIWQQTNGKIDYLVAGMGTGGTISGAAKYLKKKNQKIKIVGIDPVGSVFYHYFKTGKLIKPRTYKVEGIGEDMLVGALDFKLIDEIIQVNDRQSFLMSRKLLKEEGIFAGGSSGAAMYGALKLAKKLHPNSALQMRPSEHLHPNSATSAKKIIVVIFPDSGVRYLSKIFNNQWMKKNKFL